MMFLSLSSVDAINQKRKRMLTIVSVISPYAKVNFVYHQITDQTSILRCLGLKYIYTEDNWNLGRIGDQSFDEKSGLLTKMLILSATEI